MRAKTVFEGYEEEDLGREEFAHQREEAHEFYPEDEDDDFDEEKMREDLYDPQDDSERFCSRQPEDNFDLDQEIYDRNPDYDVD